MRKTGDLITFTEETLNGKLRCFCIYLNLGIQAEYGKIRTRKKLCFWSFFIHSFFISFKNGPSNICRRQASKKFLCFTLEYFESAKSFVFTVHYIPDASFRCTLNCFEKLYPTDSLRIQSVCLNCVMKSLLYEWKLYEKQEIIEDNIKKIKEIEDTDLPNKVTTAVNDANIALKENMLEFGKNYVLRVAAWQEGASEGM